MKAAVSLVAKPPSAGGTSMQSSGLPKFARSEQLRREIGSPEEAARPSA